MTIAPPSHASKSGSATWQQRTASVVDVDHPLPLIARQLLGSTEDRTGGGVVEKTSSVPIPARRPRRRMDGSSPTEAVTTRATPSAAWMASATSRNAGSLRPSATMRPTPASANASARPTPRLAQVTQPTRPSRRRLCGFTSSARWSTEGSEPLRGMSACSAGITQAPSSDCRPLGRAQPTGRRTRSRVLRLPDSVGGQISVIVASESRAHAYSSCDISASARRPRRCSARR